MGQPSFGERLAQLRAARGFSQYKLAELLGFSRGQIANYEQGTREPDYQTLKRIADFFDVSVDFLLGRTDDPHGTFAPDLDDPNAAAVAKIAAALQADPELLEFWQELSRRQDLQLMFKQVRDFSPESIRKIVRIIKAIEDEESE